MMTNIYFLDLEGGSIGAQAGLVQNCLIGLSYAVP